MKTSKVLVLLSSLVAVLALVANSVGLFWQDGGSPFPFTTLRGQTIQMYGQGLYRNDTFFKAPILRGTDAIFLFICIPLLILSIVLYRRGSLRGRVLLTSMLSCFLYDSASLAFGAAYNNLYLVYMFWFSASLFAFVLAFTSIDLQSLASRISPRLPRRGIAVFLIIAGLSVFVWLIDIISGLASGQAPAGLASYTTDVTGIIDLGIIAPTAFLASVLLFRRAPLGYLLAAILLILNANIGAIVMAQTVAQALHGIFLNIGQLIGYVGSFVVTSLFAIGFSISLFSSISERENQ
jgi:hypothetical protein